MGCKVTKHSKKEKQNNNVTTNDDDENSQYFQNDNYKLKTIPNNDLSDYSNNLQITTDNNLSDRKSEPAKIINNNNNSSDRFSNKKSESSKSNSSKSHVHFNENNESRRSDDIDKELLKEKNELQKRLNIVILGSDKVGKSTLFKQLELTYLALGDRLCTIERRNSSKGSTPLDENAYKEYKKIIIHNMIKGIQILTGDISIENKYDIVFANAVQGSDDNYTEVNFLALKELWSLSAVKNNFIKMNSEIDSIFDNCQNFNYFLDNIDRLMQPNYIPTYEDILKIATSTINVTDIQFDYKEHKIKISDTTGKTVSSSSHRYLQHFNDISVAIYIISLYDIEFSDPVKWANILKQFGSSINNEFFINTPIILLFSKDDLMTEKYITSDFKTELKISFHTEKDIFNNYDNYIQFLSDEFIKFPQNKNRPIFVKRVNFTSSNQVKQIFDELFTILID